MILIIKMSQKQKLQNRYAEQISLFIKQQQIQTNLKIYWHNQSDSHFLIKINLNLFQKSVKNNNNLLMFSINFKENSCSQCSTYAIFEGLKIFSEARNGSQLQIVACNKYYTSKYQLTISENYSQQIVLGYEEKPSDYLISLKARINFQMVKGLLHLMNQMNDQHGFQGCTLCGNDREKIIQVKIILQKKYTHEIKKEAINNMLQNAQKLFRIFLSKIENQRSIFNGSSKKLCNSKEKSLKLKNYRENIQFFKKKMIQEILSRQYNTLPNQEKMKILTAQLNPQIIIIDQKSRQLCNRYQEKFQRQEKTQKDDCSSGIVKTIKIQQSTIDKSWKPKDHHSYGSLIKLKAKYWLFTSIYQSTNIQIEEDSQRKIIQNYLIQKKPNINISDKYQQAVQSFKTQVWALKYMRKSFCLQISQYFFKQIQNKQKIEEIYLQYYSTSLYNYLGNIKREKNQERNQKIFLTIMKDIIKGIKFLTHINICHRDLKPGNIMLDEKFRPKIIDFGSSCPIDGSDIKSSLKFKLLSTKDYYFSYQQYKSKNPQTLISENSFNKHENFDIYSIGTLIKNMFYDSEPNLGFASIVALNICWIKQQCRAQNPYDRPSIKHLQIFWGLLCNIYQEIKHSQNSN